MPGAFGGALVLHSAADDFPAGQRELFRVLTAGAVGDSGSAEHLFLPYFCFPGRRLFRDPLAAGRRSILWHGWNTVSAFCLLDGTGRPKLICLPRVLRTPA